MLDLMQMLVLVGFVGRDRSSVLRNDRSHSDHRLRAHRGTILTSARITLSQSQNQMCSFRGSPMVSHQKDGVGAVHLPNHGGRQSSLCGLPQSAHCRSDWTVSLYFQPTILILLACGHLPRLGTLRHDDCDDHGEYCAEIALRQSCAVAAYIFYRRYRG
jgi:hypothetical protein